MNKLQRCYPEHAIKAFEDLNSYLRHKALGNVNTATLALELYETEHDKTILNMLTASLGDLSLMLSRSHEIQSIFELSEPRFSVKEIIELSQEIYGKRSLELSYSGESEVLISNYMGNVFNCMIRNAVVFREANEIMIQTNLHEDQLIISIKDNGNFFSTQIKNSFQNNLPFSIIINEESDIDLFIAKEILIGHSNSINMQDNIPRGGILILKLNYNDYLVK